MATPAMPRATEIRNDIFITDHGSTRETVSLTRAGRSSPAARRRPHRPSRTRWARAAVAPAGPACPRPRGARRPPLRSAVATALRSCLPCSLATSSVVLGTVLRRYVTRLGVLTRCTVGHVVPRRAVRGDVGVVDQLRHGGDVHVTGGGRPGPSVTRSVSASPVDQLLDLAPHRPSRRCGPPPRSSRPCPALANCTPMGVAAGAAHLVDAGADDLALLHDDHDLVVLVDRQGADQVAAALGDLGHLDAEGRRGP